MASETQPLLSASDTQKYRKIPRFLQFRSSSTFIIVVVAIATFTDSFLYGFFVAIMPALLGQRVGVAPKDQQLWVSALLAIYGLSLLVSSPPLGHIADRTSSRRIPFLSGLIASAGSTAMLCLGTSLPVLVIGRVIQGIAGALVLTVGMALLIDTLGKDGVGAAMGSISLALDAGFLGGPLLSGLVYAGTGYWGVFGLAMGVIALDIFLRLVMVEKKVLPKYGIFPKMTKDVQEAQDVPFEPEIQRPVLVEGPKQDAPLNRKSGTLHLLTLLKTPDLLLAITAYMIHTALLAAFEATLPLFVEKTFGWGTKGAGLIFLALMPHALVGPLFGRLADRSPHTARWLATGGFLTAVPFFVLLRLIDVNNPLQKVLLCGLLALIGLALGACPPALMMHVSNVVGGIEDRQPGTFGSGGAFAQAYALLNSAFAAGALLGSLWGGFIRKRFGWATMTWTLGLFSGCTGIVCLCFLGGWIGNKAFLKQSRIRT